jgi:hypothetical protein
MEDFWKQREIFRQWVEDGKKKAGVTTVHDLSEIIGAGRNTLPTCVKSTSARKPGQELLKNLATILAAIIAYSSIRQSLIMRIYSG